MDYSKAHSRTPRSRLLSLCLDRCIHPKVMSLIMPEIEAATPAISGFSALGLERYITEAVEGRKRNYMLSVGIS